MPRLLPRLLLVALAGCDGALSVSQRLAGEWVGRPETTAERTLREWPGRRAGDAEVDPDDPEVAAAIAAAPRTDLEQAGPIEVAMRLDEGGSAELTLAGEPPVVGDWSVVPLEGRRAQLEITADASGDDGGSLTRRFEVEFLRSREAFTLRESGADRRFGRLLFTRPGERAAAAATPKTPPAPEATDE